MNSNDPKRIGTSKYLAAVVPLLGLGFVSAGGDEMIKLIIDRCRSMQAH